MNLSTTCRHLRLWAALAAYVLLVSLSADARAAIITWSNVGNAGNAADASTGYGAVGYNYKISTYDVTAGQYTEFLNAVAATDSYGLWNSNMASGFAANGITQHGSSGSYTYSLSGNASFPVNYVTWGDAARFANWLQNGQPSNLVIGGLTENGSTTENGGYTLNGATSDAALMAITRNANARIFLPNENEWYKAAYYNAAANNGSYWAYPTKSNSVPSNVLSAVGTNNANYYNNGYTDPTNYLTSVGYFAGSPGPYGTYDMGGDVFQWNETAVVAGSSRGLRGGSFLYASVTLASSTRYFDSAPTSQFSLIGFRVASLPEPGSLTLMLAGAAGLLLWRKSRNA